MNTTYTVPTYEQLSAEYMRLGNDPLSLSRKAMLAIRMNNRLKLIGTKEDYARD